MSGKPFLIVVLLIFVAVIVGFLVWFNKELTVRDRITILISIFTCCGALISATFVVSSYVHTNFAFILSQKPHLLVQVITTKAIKNNVTVPNTVIHYENKTLNPFTDLTFDIKVVSGDRAIDLSELFTKKMFMAGYDQRNRNFNTLEELNNRKLDINEQVKKGNQVILKISYFYTFNRKTERIDINDYRWNGDIQQWEII